MAVWRGSRVHRAFADFLDADGRECFSCERALELTQAEYERESYHDRQTVVEFEHRRRIYSDGGRDIRQFFVDNA